MLRLFSFRIAPVLVVTVIVGVGACASAGGGKAASGPVTDVPDGEARARVADVEADEYARQPPFSFQRYLASWQPVAVRARAALALARLEHFDALVPLIDASADPAPTVRREAAFGLGQLDAVLKVDDARDEVRRDRAVNALTERLTDAGPDVRRAAIRALGRVAGARHLSTLVEVARSPQHSVLERSEALMALGVNAKRRPPTSPDPAIAKVVLESLAAPDTGRRRAAAYAALRFAMVLPDEVVARLPTDSDATVRIYAARSLRAGRSHELAASTMAGDPDWRVVIEAVAAAVRQNAVDPKALSNTLVKSVARLKQSPSAPGAAHIVGAVCEAFVNTPRDQSRNAMTAAVVSLRKVHPAAGCRCAVGLDAQDARLSFIKKCGLDGEARALLGVEVARLANLSAADKASWLATALSDPQRRVRLRAAQVLAGEATTAARGVATTALQSEQDPAVASALLSAFEGAEHTAVTPRLMTAVLERFEPADTFERAEPLLTLLRLAETQPALVGLKSRLASHPLAHVASRARWRLGERTPLLLTPPRPFREAGALPREALVVTERGEFRLSFERTRATATVDNFVNLAAQGFYDGTLFHRVVPDFVAQGGDPQGDGSGGPGYTIPCENSDLAYRRGSVGMALAGKDSGGSQFFVTHSPQPHLDGRYTVFARVVDGMDVVDALVPGDKINSIRIGPSADGS